MQRIALGIGLLGAVLGAALVGTPNDTHAQFARGRVAPEQVQPPAPVAVVYQRGRVTPPNLPALRAAAAERAAHIVKSLPVAAEPSWDSRAKGWVGPVKAQGNCGSCWDFAGTGIIEIAAVKAGIGKPGEFVLAEQYILDCVNSGGCNGDDHSTVLQHAKKTGHVFAKDYGHYRANEGRCLYREGMARFQIADWGFCDGGRGASSIAPTEDIKRCIKEYGAVSVAVAAGSSWDGYRGGVHTGNNRGINHEVILVGWQDDPNVRGGGYWIMRNSWGTGWGEGGYMKIGYGSDGIGTDAVFVTVNAPPAPPTPPGPATPEVWVLLLLGFATGVIVSGVVVFVVSRRKG